MDIRKISNLKMGFVFQIPNTSFLIFRIINKEPLYIQKKYVYVDSQSI